jgi:hypothetical protein
VAEKFRSFSEPVQKISAEPTALTASTESATEPVFLLADNTGTPCSAELPHRSSRESSAARSPTMARPRQQKDRAEPAELIPIPIPILIPLSPHLARSFPLRGDHGHPAFSFSSWPVPSHCEGTPAIPLSPFFPGPFLPIAREPRPSRFLLFFLARSFPLRGNPGHPAFSFFFLARYFPLRGNPGHPAFSLCPGSFPPIAREPRPSRFLPPSRPVPSRCEGTPAIALSVHPSLFRPEQEEPAASRSDQNDSKY